MTPSREYLEDSLRRFRTQFNGEETIFTVKAFDIWLAIESSTRAKYFEPVFEPVAAYRQTLLGKTLYADI